jgi:RNA polymerase sigma-70 factor (subfamily 1)
MLQLASRRLQGRAVFQQADLGQPLDCFDSASFHVILCALVLDSVADWYQVFREFYRLLRDPGYLVFSVGHPFDEFFAHHPSGNYFGVERVAWQMRMSGVSVLVPYFRRPLQAMLDPLFAAGFVLEHLVEPQPTAQFKEHDPADYEKLMRSPGFLCIRAKKGRGSALPNEPLADARSEDNKRPPALRRFRFPPFDPGSACRYTRRHPLTKRCRVFFPPGGHILIPFRRWYAGESAMDHSAADSTQTRALLQQAGAGDSAAFDELFTRHRRDLRAFIARRLDPKLRARVDPSDVMQETQLEVFRRLADFVARQPMPFRLWLHKTAYEQLLMLHRRHIAAARRAVGREEPLPDRSSILLAKHLLAPGSTPSRQFDRREQARRVREVIAQLPEADREVLVMRDLDGLSYQEIACLLDIDPTAARKRHGRALVRLHRLLAAGLKESPL